VTTVQQWVSDAARWSSRQGRLEIQPVPGSPAGALADPARRLSITGPCRRRFDESFKQLFFEMTGIAPAS
jgi:hypothetical protein